MGKFQPLTVELSCHLLIYLRFEIGSVSPSPSDSYSAVPNRRGGRNKRGGLSKMAKNRAKNANFGKNWQKSREISVFLGLKIKKIGNVPPPSIWHCRVVISVNMIHSTERYDFPSYSD